MTNQHCNAARSFPLARLAPLAAAVALLGTACGPTTATSSPVEAEPASEVADTAAPVATETARGIDSVPTTTVSAAPPTTVGAPCGEFGPIPPIPDSMYPQFFDTDGDAEPDSVQAYAGGGQPWTLRVIENGITSEAVIPAADGFAAIVGSVNVESREHVLVRDFENGDVHTFATNSDGCVELLGTDPGTDPDPADDLVLTNPTIPVPTIPVPTIPLPKTPVTIDPVIIAPIAPTPCGNFDPIPAGSQITSNLMVDLVGDGVADDQVITYLDGVYKLRSVRNGVTSEVTVPDVGVSSIRALGVGDAGEISVGNEVIVRTGGGASAAEIGIFGHDADGCVFQFTLNGSDLEMYVGATIGTSSGMFCAEGVIAQWYYELDDDDTYFGSSAAFFESTAGDFTYLPNSDDFSEGLALDDLSPAELDCFGFGL